MRMDWLDDLLAVAEAGSFVEAAQRRNLTPSAFSRRLQGIEAHVGAELFDRSRKPAQLRPGVAAQRDRLSRLAAETRALVADLRRGEQASNQLVISAQHALTATLAPRVMQEIRRHRADIHVRLRSGNLADCFAQLFARQADIALVYGLPGDAPPIEGTSVERMIIGEDRLIPVGAPDLGGALQRAAWDAGTGHGDLPVVAYPSDVFLGQVVERHLRPRLPDGMRARAVAETALTLAAMEMAANGLGIAWVPRSLARESLRAHRLSDLSDGLPSCALDVTAVRLQGDPGPAGVEVWTRLAALRGVPGAPDP